MDKAGWEKRAWLLAWFTVVYNLVEAAFSVRFGVENQFAAILLGLLILKEGIEGIRAARSPGFTGGCGCGHD